MLNQVVLIGRLKDEPILKKDENGISFCECDLSIKRSFKNENGKYDTDFIKIKMLKKELATSFSTYAEKGTLVAIKGRIEPVKYHIDDKEVDTNLIIAEKITYL